MRPQTLLKFQTLIPCSDTLGPISLGSIMLHDRVRLDSMSKLGAVIGDVSSYYTSRAVHIALQQEQKIALDANAYEHMASFAWS